MGPWLLQRHKESPTWASSSPSIAGHFLGDPLRSSLMGITWEICRAQPLRIRQKQRREVGLQQPAFRSWWTKFLLALLVEQRSKPGVVPTHRTKAVSLGGQGPWSSILIRALNQRVVCTMEPVLWPCLNRDENLLPHQLLSVTSSPTPPGSPAGEAVQPQSPLSSLA